MRTPGDLALTRREAEQPCARRPCGSTASRSPPASCPPSDTGAWPTWIRCCSPITTPPLTTPMQRRSGTLSRRSVRYVHVVLEHDHPGTVAVLRRPLLRQRLLRQRAERLAAGSAYAGSGLVIRRLDGTPVNPTDWVARSFKRAKRLDLPHIRFHDLRHTHATLALQLGVHRRSRASGWVTPARRSCSTSTATPSRGCRPTPPRWSAHPSSADPPGQAQRRLTTTSRRTHGPPPLRPRRPASPLCPDEGAAGTGSDLEVVSRQGGLAPSLPTP